MRKRVVAICLLQVVALTSIASAHYLWVIVDKKSETAHIYFEGGPGPGDGQYLDPFLQADTTWVRTVENPRAAKLKTAEAKAPKKRWMTAKLASPGPRSVDSYGKWGVYRYGKTDVLLHYYARHLDVQTHEDLHELARADQMKLDIAPHDHGKEVQLAVVWNKKPAAGRLVYVRGPKGFKHNAKTNDKGIVTFQPEAAGRYTFRTNVEEKKSGKDADKEYSLVRHHATLTMQLPLEK